MTPVSTAATLAVTLAVPAVVAHACGVPGGWVGAGIVVVLAGWGVCILATWVLGVAAAIGRPSVVADAPDEGEWDAWVEAALEQTRDDIALWEQEVAR